MSSDWRYVPLGYPFFNRLAFISVSIACDDWILHKLQSDWTTKTLLQLVMRFVFVISTTMFNTFFIRIFKRGNTVRLLCVLTPNTMQSNLAKILSYHVISQQAVNNILWRWDKRHCYLDCCDAILPNTFCTNDFFKFMHTLFILSLSAPCCNNNFTASRSQCLTAS